MSIFDFVKAAGKKLIEQGKYHTGPSSAKAPDDTQDTAEKLKQYLSQLNIGLQNPNVKIEGDKAIIEGTAPTQEAMEKAILAIGNTAGIAKVESRITAPTATQPRFYTVKQGDTLSKIAKEYLGDASRYEEIFEANRPLLKDPDEIYPGQNLRIPEKELV
jgi:nucleoid-associated protein YgaU